MSTHSRLNNFDLIRLVAAMQVVFSHAVGHTPVMENAPPWLRWTLDIVLLFPGVAVFFVVSGFLIAKSYERLREDRRVFFWHRALRIYPSLWMCLAASLLVLGAFGFLGREVQGSANFWAWLAGQLTIGQFYNPEFFREFGVGVVNGALWTITVELQFYFVLPIIYPLMFPSSRNGPSAKLLLALSFAVSFLVFWHVDVATNGPGGFGGAPMMSKLIYVTLLPHWWMFLLGILIHRHHDRLSVLLDGRFTGHLMLYAAVASARQLLIDRHGPWSLLFYIGYLPERILLAMLTISAAYTARGLSARLLGGSDISYGVYIYHFIVINVMLELGWMQGIGSVAVVFVISAILGMASWHGVEKRALSFKPLFVRQDKTTASNASSIKGTM